MSSLNSTYNLMLRLPLIGLINSATYAMNKNEKIILQCADCDFKYKKTLKWLENTHTFICSSCDVELDIDEVINDIVNDEEGLEIFTIYQK